MESKEIKDIPMKPRRVSTCALPPYDIAFYCGKCGEMMLLVNGQQEFFKYCNECGSPIDWSD